MSKEAFIQLFGRDIKRLQKEIAQYPSEQALWAQLPGTINSGGNLCQHLIGNLRTYVGLTLGGIAYTRDRDAEFNQQTFTQNQLIEALNALHSIITQTLAQLDDPKMAEPYPREALDMFPDQPVELVLMHLLAHLSWHLGQINYHRRAITQLSLTQS